jgi:hypothetical protein
VTSCATAGGRPRRVVAGKIHALIGLELSCFAVVAAGRRCLVLAGLADVASKIHALV